jgi:hypothetical protein
VETVLRPVGSHPTGEDTRTYSPPAGPGAIETAPLRLGTTPGVGDTAGKRAVIEGDGVGTNGLGLVLAIGALVAGAVETGVGFATGGVLGEEVCVDDPQAAMMTVTASSPRSVRRIAACVRVPLMTRRFPGGS